MRFFGGLSFGRRGARAGVSASGRPWSGARVGAIPGTYIGVRSGPSRALRHLEDTRPKPTVSFRVDEFGRVFLGDAQLDVDDLREVIEASDEAARRKA